VSFLHRGRAIKSGTKTLPITLPPFITPIFLAIHNTKVAWMERQRTPRPVGVYATPHPGFHCISSGLSVDSNLKAYKVWLQPDNPARNPDKSNISRPHPSHLLTGQFVGLQDLTPVVLQGLKSIVGIPRNWNKVE
jgi:hypothetical protein